MLCPGGDQSRVRVLGDVVVVEVEAPTRDPLRGRESVKLVEITVTDEVRPEPPVGGPAGVVDQDRH